MLRLRQLLLIFAVLLTSCGAVRKSIVSNEKGGVSMPEQRKYEYYFLEALRLEQLERYDEAFEMLQHCLAICPAAPSAQYKMANYYFAFNERTKAVEALTCAVKGAPDNYWYQQALALYYQSNREYDKAIAVVEEMQKRFPKRDGELLPALVGLYGHTKQYDKVIDALTRLEVIIGKSEGISMEKVRNYLFMGNTEGAFSEVEALVAEYPENSYYRVVLAEVYMDYGRVDKAEPVLLGVLAEDPDNGPAKITLTEYYKQQGDTARYLSMADEVVMCAEVDDEMKVRLMAQLITENPDSTWIMELFERAVAQPQRSARLGHLCVQYMLHLQQPEERVRPILLRMLEIEPDNIPARSQLLSYAAMRNDMEEVVGICSEGIDYTPEVLEYYYYKGIGLCYFMERPYEALETFRQAIRQFNEGSDTKMVTDIYSAMGDLLQELGEMSEACTCYEKVLEYIPNHTLVLNNYAYLLAQEERDLEKAEQMSRLAIEAEPDNATYLDTYAWVLYKLHRYEEALTYIEQAISADTQPSDVLYEHVGDIYRGLGNTTQALYYWRKAILMQREGGAVDKNLEKKIKGIKR